MSIVGSSDAPEEMMRWQLAERFGWELEYIDNLKMEDIHEFLQVEDGKVKASQSLLRKK